jgi:hypothetical protein
MFRGLLLEADGMKLFRFFALLAACAAISSAAHAQSFPGRDGHWEATVKSAGQDPMKLEFCLNNDTWKRAVFANKSCTVSQTGSTLNSTSYHLDCDMHTATMKGDTTIRFDGKEHMTSTSKFDTVMQGKSSTIDSTVDYNWKASACTGKEVNLLAEKHAIWQQN